MAQTDDEYIFLYHNDRDIKTIEDFVKRHNIYGIKADELFDENRKIIFEQMTFSEKVSYCKENGLQYSNFSESDLKSSMTLPLPCNIAINPSKINICNSIEQTNLITEQNDYFAFLDEKISDITQDNGYVKDENFSKVSPDVRVFGWFKSYYYFMRDNKDTVWRQENTPFKDLSKHVISIATNSGRNGGSFVIKLPSIKSQKFNDLFVKKTGIEDWNPLDMSNIEVSEVYDSFQTLNIDNSTTVENEDGYYHKAPFDDIDKNIFNAIISSNDLIFIAFEKLEMENEDKYIGDMSISDNFKVAGNVFDMIGLVDDIREVSDAGSAESHIEITGRDLMKILIDDGSFFFNVSNTSDPSTIFINQNEGKQGDVVDASYTSDPLLRIRRLSKEIDVFANRINMDIEFVVKEVIGQLANVEIVPDYVFESWKEKRTKFISLQSKKE